MHTSSTYQPFEIPSKLYTGILLFILVFGLANVILDFTFTRFRGSAFYLSESLLFSSYWVLYLPLLSLVVKTFMLTESFVLKLVSLGLAVVFHLLLYPALVWGLSLSFYDHTFEYFQTFQYGLPSYFIQTVLIYGLAFTAFSWLNKRTPLIEKVTAENKEHKAYLHNIWVADKHNQKVLVQTQDILYFSADAPYISIFHASKKYLHTETLKSLEKQLDPNRFIRIHKSHIVNLGQIVSLRSRKNGDYDIRLSEGTVLRLSRNYVKNFKSKFKP